MLRFVQTAFKYKTDNENFVREKPLFPEETLYYEYSDCENRSILFAHLVQELLVLEVIGLNYPGHIATAVRFNTNVTGDYITYNEKKYPFLILLILTLLLVNVCLNMNLKNLVLLILNKIFKHIKEEW